MKSTENEAEEKKMAEEIIMVYQMLTGATKSNDNEIRGHMKQWKQTHDTPSTTWEAIRSDVTQIGES